MPFSIGENIGPYRIVEKLGHGGMATVFKAYHPALDRFVAIKVLHPAFQQDANFLARFQREARIVAKLDHPNIVPIYDFAEHRGHPYLVMRFVEGMTLKARLEQGPLSYAEINDLLQAVGSALEYAHQQGVLHRDIKPSNVMITRQGHYFLTDFGLARMAEAGETTLSRDVMVGTPQYISPEQAKGVSHLDARTDVYSLGVVLYELLVGRVPFQADTPYAVIHDHIFTPLPLPRNIQPELPEALERLLLKALAKEPDDRFQSVAEMTAAFGEVLAAQGKPAVVPVAPSRAVETIVVPPPDAAQPAAPPAKEEAPSPAAKVAPVRKKRRWPWVVAACAAVLFLGLAFVVVKPGQWVRSLRNAPETPMPPGDAATLLAAARAAQEAANPSLALQNYRWAIESDPHLIDAYLEAGRLLVTVGRFDEALDLYAAGIEENPDVADLYLAISETACAAGRWDELSNFTEWLLTNRPNDPRSHAFAAVAIASDTGTCMAARPELETALRLGTGPAWAAYAEAFCLYTDGDWMTALGKLAQMQSRGPLPHTLEAAIAQVTAVLEEQRNQAVNMQFDTTLELIGEIPNKALRTDLTRRIEGARIAWDEGRKTEAVSMVQDALALARERQAELGAPLGRDIEANLDRLARMLVAPRDEPGPPQDTPFGSEIQALVALANQVESEALRTELKDLIGRAERAWNEGRQQDALDTLGEIAGWLESHGSKLPAPLLELLNVQLHRTIDAAQLPQP